MEGNPEPPEVAAERARERLHEEIERVRSGVEEMLAEQQTTASMRPSYGANST